jgi:thymidylate synthase ThyX
MTKRIPMKGGDEYDALADMCRLRCATDTQAETQKVAWDIYFVMEKLFPASWAALMEDRY